MTAENALDDAYRERAHLVAWLAACYSAVLAPAPDVQEGGWQIVYVSIGDHQLSWHIAPEDLDLFLHVERVGHDDPRAQWDGHTTEQKYDTIRAIIPDIVAAGEAARKIEASLTRITAEAHMIGGPWQ